MIRIRRSIGVAIVAVAAVLDARAALAQCATRVEPSFISSLQHPAVVQAAWTLPAITPDNVKARGGLPPMMDAEQRHIDATQAAISVESQAAQRNGDRLAMLRDDARLHREYLRLLQCHASAPLGPAASATVNVGGGALTVSGGGPRRMRSPGSDLVNAFLNRAPSEATQDKIRSERASNDAARTEFNTLQVDATGNASVANTDLRALRSSLSAVSTQNLADDFALLAGTAPKAASPGATCPKGALGFRGYCASATYLTVGASTASAAPAGIAGAAQRAVRVLKGHIAAPGGLVDPVLEYFELGLEQEGANGERFLEPVGRSAAMPAAWSAFQSASPVASSGLEFLFDLLGTAPPPPTEDSITVGLRQADDALQELVAARAGDFRPGPGGTTIDSLIREMCVTCGSVAIDPAVGTSGSYAAVARLVQ